MAEGYTWVISQANVTATTAPSTGSPTRTARVSRHTGSRRRKSFGRGRLATTAVSATSSSSFTSASGLVLVQHATVADSRPGNRTQMPITKACDLRIHLLEKPALPQNQRRATARQSWRVDSDHREGRPRGTASRTRAAGVSARRPQARDASRESEDAIGAVRCTSHSTLVWSRRRPRARTPLWGRRRRSSLPR
jgi:hypothetical protein